MERACADDGLSSKISGLSGLLSISSILSLVLLVFPRPSKGSVWGSTQTHVGAGTRALLGPRASASRRRALRGAARGGADAVSRFPLLAPEARCGALRTPSIRGNGTTEIQACWHTEAGRSGCVGHASAWRKHALLRAGAPPRQGHKKRKIFGAETTASSSWSWAFFRVQTCCDFSRLQFESPNESSLASVLV